ncbi:ion channel [Bowmanella denitrificans]|uniref:Ion channel n=1 Tax=Bowmanella denitrificans TaxID=366582 RepID=A0ABP3HQ36_9ALTE
MTNTASPVNDEAWKSGELASAPQVKTMLEARAKTGQTMQGFKLARADLEGLDLVNAGAKTGFRLIQADLYRANLRNAHCFMLDLSGSSLMKADLQHANLHYADLRDCNLLGARLSHARIEQVNWGMEIIQERQARQAKSKDIARDYYQQAEETYRNLRKVCEEQGLFENAGRFFQREMVVRRMLMPRYSAKRLVSKLVDLFCGYGEQPIRVMLFSLLVIFTFSLLFVMLGIHNGEHLMAFAWQQDWRTNLNAYFTSLYLSVVTFTTLGYGDVTPFGITRTLAAIEAFIGSFTLALFVVVFVKKMTR